MKRTTVVGITNDSLVHPDSLKGKLNSIRKKIEKRVLDEQNTFTHCECPACHSTRHDIAFVKSGYNYQQCLDCNSVFLSPRPSLASLKNYYNSDYTEFLETEEYLETVQTFNEIQAQSRADQIIINQNKVENKTNKVLLFAPKSELLKKALSKSQIVSIKTEEAPWNTELDHDDNSYDVIAAFDIFERLPNPSHTLNRLVQRLTPGGRILITTRSGGGFDLLTLWHHLDLCPVEHMNLFTIEALQIMANDSGLTLSEVSTPGVLDVQFVDKTRQEKKIKTNRFIEYLLENRDEFTKNELQQFLQKGLLSSHLYAIGVRK